MIRHRLASEALHYRLPEPPLAPIVPGSFAVCAVFIPQSQMGCIQGLATLYRLALDRARVAARVTHPSRRLFATWN